MFFYLCALTYTEWDVGLDFYAIKYFGVPLPQASAASYSFFRNNALAAQPVSVGGRKERSWSSWICAKIE